MSFFDDAPFRVGAGVLSGGASEASRMVFNSASDMFGGGDSPNMYNEGMFNERKAQIDQFEKNLAGARAKYQSSLGNMYNTAYSRYADNLVPQFAARGLETNGGAFAAELARKTADYQAQLEPSVYNAEREDLGAVNAARGSLFGVQQGAYSQNALAQYQAQAARSRAMGGLMGQAGLMVLGNALLPGAGGVVAGAAGSALSGNDQFPGLGGAPTGMSGGNFASMPGGALELNGTGMFPAAPTPMPTYNNYGFTPYGRNPY